MLSVSLTPSMQSFGAPLLCSPTSHVSAYLVFGRRRFDVGRARDAILSLRPDIKELDVLLLYDGSFSHDAQALGVELSGLCRSTSVPALSPVRDPADAMALDSVVTRDFEHGGPLVPKQGCTIVFIGSEVSRLAL